MDEGELDALLRDHYRGEAQTLTTGAEENLLKLAELLGSLSKEERTRWQEIREEYVRRKKLGGDDADGSQRIANTLLDISRAVDGLRAQSETTQILKKGLAALVKSVGELEPSITIAAPDTTAFGESLKEMKELYDNALLPLITANYRKMKLDHSIWEDVKRMHEALRKLENAIPDDGVFKARITGRQPGQQG